MMQLKNAQSVEQALAVMVQASAFSSADSVRLTALVQSSQQSDDTEGELGAPGVAAYTSHSGDIVATLEDLEEKAQAQLDSARKEETSSKQHFEMMQLSLEDSIKYGNKDLDKAKKGLAAAGEAKGTAEGDLSVTSKDLASDVASLAELHHDCMTKAEEFEAATKSRGEELKALAEAKKVLSSSTVGAEAQTYDLAQVSLLQLRSKSPSLAAVRFVRRLGEKTGSAALAQLAMRMTSAVRSGAATEDVFAKVKGLINDMIERLLAEAQAEADKKAYCDKEMAESNAKKDDKTAEIAKLTTKIDKMSTQSNAKKDDKTA